MSRICYKEHTFREKGLLVIAQANGIFEKYYEQGFDLTLRQLYYQLVSTGEDNMEFLGFPIVKGTHNNKKSYNRLVAIISDGRLAGLIDWEIIVDRTRNLKGWMHFDSAHDAVRHVSLTHKLDKWIGQDYYVEVWVEKDALIGIVNKACHKWDVKYFSTRGYISQSEMWGAAQRMNDRTRYGKTPVLLHLSDHDPSGIDMGRDIKDRFCMFESNVNIVRVALTMDQVEEYNPSPNFAKTTDVRFKGYEEEYGDRSWELDALEPEAILRHIDSCIEAFVDRKKFDAVESQQEADRECLEKVADQWDDIVKGLKK